MRFLFDFFPIILFFLVYKTKGIYFATGTAILATLFQLIWHKLKTGRYEKTHLISFVTIVILGSATLLLQDDTFIKWKTTAVYWVLAILLLGSQIFGRKNIIQHLAEQSVQLPQRIWRRLNTSWACFFALMGLANLYVVYHYDTNTWVNFKLFGTLGLTILFVIGQGMYMSKYIDNGKM